VTRHPGGDDQLAMRRRRARWRQVGPVDAAAAITQATGIPVRYEQFADSEAAAISPIIAETKKRWEAGHRWHADIEALRVIHPGLRRLPGLAT
jgi:hypothetical protein